MLMGKGPDAGKDWRHKDKGPAEEEIVGWHHWHNGHEFEQTGREWREGKPSVVAKSQTGLSDWTTTNMLMRKH